MDVEGSNHCKILGKFGFAVQGMLGLSAFFVLFIKRHFEKPKRQWKIWALDTSKQATSALVAHLINVILAIMLSRVSNDDACNWYFITIFFDTTVGVFFCYVLLQSLQMLLSRYGCSKLNSGNYFRIIKPEDI